MIKRKGSKCFHYFNFNDIHINFHFPKFSSCISVYGKHSFAVSIAHSLMVLIKINRWLIYKVTSSSGNIVYFPFKHNFQFSTFHIHFAPLIPFFPLFSFYLLHQHLLRFHCISSFSSIMCSYRIIFLGVFPFFFSFKIFSFFFCSFFRAGLISVNFFRKNKNEIGKWNFHYKRHGVEGVKLWKCCEERIMWEFFVLGWGMLEDEKKQF